MQKKRHLSPCLMLITVFAGGCSVIPASGMPTADRSAATETALTTALTFNFFPEKNTKTQAVGDYAPDGAYSTEMRLQYTEGVVRFEGRDYHIGLDANTDKLGYKFNYGEPSFDVVPLRYCYASESVSLENPILPKISANPGTEWANATTNALLDGAYFLGRGLYSFPTTDATWAPEDILWYDSADLEYSNNGYHNRVSEVATFSARLDPSLSSALPSLDATEAVFKKIFRGTKIVYQPNPSLPATTSFLVSPAITAPTKVRNGYLQVVSKGLVGPGGATAKTLYFKLFLPASVHTVQFPNLPLGRLVVDVRKYNAPKALSSYGYAQIMLSPQGNALNINEISCQTASDPTRIDF